ncbi:MAG: Xaa-Pro peptidase family protein [Methanomicrobiales archaeon]|nr:Xaa-Pro peptidase family protein [Methanomicrobiales archaeon]
MDPLDEVLEGHHATAYVAVGSSLDGDIRYLTQFRVSDPIIFIKKKGAPGAIVVSSMEYERAQRESIAQVISRNEAGFFEYLKEDPNNRPRATARMIASLSGGEVVVPANFPLGLARELEAFCQVTVDRDAVQGMRAVKSSWEIAQIRKVQNAAEAAMAIAIGLIERSRPSQGILILDGHSLTSERVKVAIHTRLIEQGCTARDTIVSCGTDSALPHHTGAGPLLPHEPIIIDLFPQDEATGYYADMTRTVCHGEPSPDIVEMYWAVKEAKKITANAIRDGVSGADLHLKVVQFLSDQGYESNSQGFMHNLGHGIGLDVHEKPVLGPGGDLLKPGNVFTLEPGLYYHEKGGVRLEDVGCIVNGGFEQFTKFEERLVV